jgi:hypothetical protein
VYEILRLLRELILIFPRTPETVLRLSRWRLVHQTRAKILHFRARGHPPIQDLRL